MTKAPKNQVAAHAATPQGEKQHGGLIARHDAFPGHRFSITAVTSSWSDGSAGPLGLCVPDGALSKAFMEQWNSDHLGTAYVFTSERKGHFMTGATFLQLLQELVTPALALQRKKLHLDHSVPALILADAWSGYHGVSSGLDQARKLWSDTANCKLPDLQAGGWSACCQPVDQLHAVFRSHIDYLDASDVGCVADLRKRQQYSTMPIRSNGQPQHKKLDHQSLVTRTLLAWQAMLGPYLCVCVQGLCHWCRGGSLVCVSSYFQ